MKPRSTVTALLAVTASLLAAKADAARVKRTASVSPLVSPQADVASTKFRAGRRPFVLRLKTQPVS